MSELYLYPPDDYRLYLAHHGVKGQKHGVRNAEWYPIAAYKAHLARTGQTHGSAAQGKSYAEQKRAEYSESQKAKKKSLNPLKDFLEKSAKSKVDRVRKDTELKNKAQKLREKQSNGEKLTKTEKDVIRRSESDSAKEAYETNQKIDAETRKELASMKEREANQQEIMAKGTMNEILSLAGIADNAALARALQNRQLLDKELEKVGAKPKKKLDRILEYANRASEVASTVGNLANKSLSAYNDVSKVLEAMGLKEKGPANKFKGKNAAEISANIMKAIAKGDVSIKEIENLKNFVDNVDYIDNRSRYKDLKYEDLNDLRGQIMKQAKEGKLSPGLLSQYNSRVNTLNKLENDSKEKIVLKGDTVKELRENLDKQYRRGEIKADEYEKNSKIIKSMEDAENKDKNKDKKKEKVTGKDAEEMAANNWKLYREGKQTAEEYNKNKAIIDAQLKAEGKSATDTTGKTEKSKGTDSGSKPKDTSSTSSERLNKVTTDLISSTASALAESKRKAEKAQKRSEAINTLEKLAKEQARNEKRGKTMTASEQREFERAYNEAIGDYVFSRRTDNDPSLTASKDDFNKFRREAERQYSQFLINNR